MRRLLASLPSSVYLHTPKIGGSHIYWHAPFIQELENPQQILDVAPGTFLYWPERQFLEITFAPLQAETAEVNVIGRVDAMAVEVIAQLAKALRQTQGQRIIRAQLLLEGAQISPVRCSSSETLMSRDLRRIWDEPPHSLMALLAQRGIMHPAGPLLFAESEARAAQELLWSIRQTEDTEGSRRAHASLTVHKAASRLGGFCHLAEVSAALERASSALRTEPSFMPLLDDCILYFGRLADWADLSIPWNGLNELMRRYSCNMIDDLGAEIRRGEMVHADA